VFYRKIKHATDIHYELLDEQYKEFYKHFHNILPINIMFSNINIKMDEENKIIIQCDNLSQTLKYFINGEYSHYIISKQYLYKFF
jgi:hypothetical protein